MTAFLPTPRDLRVLNAVRIHVRMTAGQLRLLYFVRPDGDAASVQVVSARLRKLLDQDLLDAVVLDRGRGAGPYAYGLGRRGAALLAEPPRKRGTPGPVWHHLEVAELRLQLELGLRRRRGALVEWTGEPVLRSLLRRKRAWATPDALVHWRLPGREGAFLLEWDRGTESLAILTRKFQRYAAYADARGHRYLLPGLGIRPRLAIVVSTVRSERLQRYLLAGGTPPGLTVALGTTGEALRDPFARTWWRSDLKRRSSLFA